MSLLLTNKNHARFLGHSVFIFLNRFFNNIAGLLVIFFYAHRLAQVDYGHYQSFWIQLNIFNAVLGLGISMFSLTYPPEKLRAFLKQIKPRFYLGYLLFLMLCGLLFSGLQTGSNLHFPWPLLFLAAFALCNISDALLIAFRRFRFLVGINILYAIGFFSIHYAFIKPPFQFNSLLAYLLPLLLIKLTASAWVLFRHSIRKKDTNAQSEDASVYKGMYLLWAHLYFYDMLQIASLWIDKFLISLFMDSKETAIYINGTLNIPFLPILFSALTGSALIHLADKHQGAERINMVNQVGRVLSSVAFPIVVFLAFFRTEFIIFCFSDKYLASIPIFLCAIMIIPFRAYGHTVLLQHLERGKLINQGAVLDVVAAVLLMYPLYLWLGLPGVALSFVFSTLIQSLFYGIHTKKLLQVPLRSLYPLKNWLFKAAFFTFAGGCSYYLLADRWSGTIRLFVGCGIMATLSLLVLWKEIRRRDKTLLPTTKA